MTDERLAKLGALYPYPNSIRAELHRALLAERGRVVELSDAITDLADAFPASTSIERRRRAYQRAVAVLAEGATDVG